MALGQAIVGLAMLITASLGSAPALAVVRSETTAGALNLFQRIARAPLIVQIRIRDGRLKYAAVEIVRTIKGEPSAPALRIAFRDYNLFRAPGTDPIVFPDGQEEILLLEPHRDVKKREKHRDIYALYGGPAGRYVLPAEGKALIPDAFDRLTAIARLDPTEQITALWELLGSDNPYLLEAAMEEIDRLRAVSPLLLGRLVALLQRRAPDVRILALRIMAHTFRLLDLDAIDELAAEQARTALNAAIERARNDPQEKVRVAGVETVIAWPRRAEVRGDLEGIARIDPAQAVRYVAQRALVEIR